MPSCTVPAIEDREAWAFPAEPGEAKDAAVFLATAIEPSLVENPNRLRTLTGLVAMQDYTRAELLLAMKRLPFANNYGQGFRLDVLDEIVQTSRTVRRIVADPTDGKPRMMTERQMYDACQEHPEHFRREDFGICGYDANDRPFYRYAKASGPHKHNPTPQLPEAAEVRREGGGGTVSIADALTPPNGDNRAAA